MSGDAERELGRLAGTVESIREHIARVETQLDKHIDDENAQLLKIQQDLSLGRFMWLALKACVLTIAFVAAFKFGDISGLWKELK